MVSDNVAMGVHMKTFGRSFEAARSFFTAFAVLAIAGAAAPALADSDVQESVTGHVQFVNTTSGNTIRYSLSAIRHPDGTVTGEFEEHVYSATGEFVRRTHGVNICFTIEGNMARTGGIVTEGEGNAPPPGTEVFATVVDQGEGANDPPDLASPGGSGPPGSAVAHCTVGFRRSLFPIVAGNIQVRPAND